MRNVIPVLILGILAGCGQKGPLYLPEERGEVVTRPAETPPESETTAAPNSPQTPDSQPAAPAPAPEVTAPEEESKKDKGASPPPPS
ncbi:MAG TPA: lipoprotein [Steroidobacteraceae bacterium]